jgi:putative PEP-CTERM system integral membrane protein
VSMAQTTPEAKPQAPAVPAPPLGPPWPRRRSDALGPGGRLAWVCARVPHGLFWAWNAIFLAFALLGLAPHMLPSLVRGTWLGSIPPLFLAYACAVVLIPLLAVVLAAVRLRRDPAGLFTLGYAVEGPAVLLALVSLFVVREMTPAVSLLLALAAAGQVALLWSLLDRGIDRRGRLATFLRSLGLTLMALIGVYAAAVVAFYAVPLAAQLGNLVGGLIGVVGGVLAGLRHNPAGLSALPLLILGGCLLLFSATLFVLMPLALPYLYLRAWWQGTNALAARSRVPTALLFQAAVAIAVALAFSLSLRQPQAAAFELLRTPPQSTDQANALRQQEPLLREGLRNAYLAPLRYLSSFGQVTHISELYRQSIGLSSEHARAVQGAYEWLLSPVLYLPMEASAAQPSSLQGRPDPLRVDPDEAAKLYRAFFDEPIIDGERSAVVQAVRSTWDSSLAARARQEVEDREILLTHQEITLREHGDWADLELYEVYQNQTLQRQEVVYYFNLPESAVITGVWLGTSPDRSRRFEYRVAPRGAAQSLYRSEVRRNVDPALVEQLGPRQYRLRVFPIEPGRTSWDASGRSASTPAPETHLWMTWRTLAIDSGWPMPRLSEKRNVYWDWSTKRLLNGGPLLVEDERWLPAALAVPSRPTPLARRATFPGGETVSVRPASAGDLPPAPSGLRLAVVLDRSRSMQRHADQVRATLDRLPALAPVAQIDVYLTTSTYRGEPASRVPLSELAPASLDYLGGQHAFELLAQFESLRDGRAYDGALILTDGNGFELGGSPGRLPAFDFPIWMVHLADELSLGYDDATLAAIQSSGGSVAGSVDEMWPRFLAARSIDGLPSDSPRTALVDGYLWTTTPASAAPGSDGGAPIAPEDGFGALAARHLILDAMHRQRASLDRIANLDALHSIAKQQAIVSPYSSMIVLVTSEQQRRLDALEQAGDRFERQTEAVGETVPPSPANVTAVPEPHEWLLIGLAAAMLAWYWRRRSDRPWVGRSAR